MARPGIHSTGSVHYPGLRVYLRYSTVQYTCVYDLYSVLGGQIVTSSQSGNVGGASGDTTPRTTLESFLSLLYGSTRTKSMDETRLFLFSYLFKRSDSSLFTVHSMCCWVTR